jgi:hypothetical protein
MRTTLVLLCCSALTLSACNSGSAEVDETPPPASPAPPNPSPPAPPPSPTPPAPTPPAPPAPTPPAPGNQSPSADAGSDKSTVEEQDVTIDGSRSRDPESGPLTYAWSLVSAPQGSGLTLDARSATFAFRPDVPGTYDLRLTVSDGSSTDTDTVRVRAEALVSFEEGGSFKVERRDDDDDDEKHRRPIELELRTSELYRGSRVAFTVSTDAAWLRAVEPAGLTASRGEETEVHVVLVMDEVDRMPRGEHEAHVIVTPNGGWERAQARVTLKIEGGDDKIAPYVGYTGELSFVTVYGSDLTAATGAHVFVDNVDVGPLSVASDTEGTIALPALEAGEHTLRVGADGEAMRLVVRDLPVHGATDVPLAGTATSLEYDAERDAFYGVFVAADGTRSARRLRNAGTGTWVADAIAIDAARDVALTADGADLLVAADSCIVHRLDPQTLALRESLTDASCAADRKPFGPVMKLVDGQPVAIVEATDPTLWAYPDGSRTFVPLPNIASFEFAEGVLHVRELP